MNPIRKLAIGGALAAATISGGALGASLFGTANAATNSSSDATSSTAAPADATQARPAFPAHGTPEHESQETAVTGDNATKAQAAAVASVGGGTAGDVTTDMSGKGYEVTVTKADGSQVEVHLDSNFTVMQCGPGGHRGPGGPNDNDADGAPAATAPTTTAG
jgi:hypothetical protein